MESNRKTYGILFAKADLISVEDYLLMKQCLNEKLVDTVFFVPSYIFNDGNEIFNSQNFHSLMNYNKEILSTIPGVMIWSNEIMLFKKALTVNISDSKRLHLINRLNETRCPEDIILTISAYFDYHNVDNSSNIIKIIANSTILKYKNLVSNDSSSMWETFNCLANEMIIDSLQLSAIKNRYKEDFLQFEQIKKIDTKEYRQIALASRPEYDNLNIYEAIEIYSHEPSKYTEIFETLSKLLTEIKIEESEKSCKKYKIVVLFEENDSLLLHLNDNDELEPLSYTYSDEAHLMSSADEHILKAHAEFVVNDIIKKNTGYDIPAKCAVLLNIISSSNEETLFYYLNLKDVPVSLCKWNLEFTNSTDMSRLKRISIKRNPNNNSIFLIGYGHNSKMLKDALDYLQALGQKNESKLEEKPVIDPPSETVTERDAVTTYQWNSNNNPFDFLNSAKLVISVTYQGFPSQENKDNII